MNKSKLNYTPSKNEFLLILLLLIVAIAALSINYLLLPEWGRLNMRIQEYKNQNILVGNLRSEYDKLDVYLEEEAMLASDLDELRLVIPDYFSEEELLSSVDANASKSGLQLLGITFSGITADSQDTFLAGLKMSASPDGSAAAGVSEGDSSYIESERIMISFSGSYENLVSFLSAFESETRQVYFRSAASSRGEDGTLNGTLTMLAFSSRGGPSPAGDTDYPGYDYDAPAPSGKDDPFAAFTRYDGASASTSSASASPDFYVILNTYDDNSSKVLMGKYPVSGTQITANQNKNMQASLKLSKSGTTCSYTYILGDESYSGSFALNVGETGLSVSILSRARKSSLDNVGIRLNVENNSGLPLKVIVKNDDASNPRFHLGTTIGSVQVVK